MVDKHSFTMRRLVANMYRITNCISSMKYVCFWLFSVIIMRSCSCQQFTDFRLLYYVHVLVTFVSYYYIIKWKELEFGLWEEQGEYGSNLMSGGWSFYLASLRSCPFLVL